MPGGGKRVNRTANTIVYIEVFREKEYAEQVQRASSKTAEATVTVNIQ